MTGNNLDACLKQFSLEKYLSNFKSRGINRRSELASLTMQDYPSLGITSMKDREKLFHMIQNLKAAEEKENAKTSRQNELKGDKSKVSCKVFTEQRESSKSILLYCKEHSYTKFYCDCKSTPLLCAYATTMINAGLNFYDRPVVRDDWNLHGATKNGILVVLWMTRTIRLIYDLVFIFLFFLF